MAKAKEETEAPTLDSEIEAINKEYGLNSVIKLSQKPVGVYDVIPTGSLTFDYGVLGIGGVAKGRIYEIRGWEGVGKSTICGHLAANCQKQGGRVLYMDGEFALDTEYFSNLGVNVEDEDNFLISQPNDGTQGFDIALRLIKTGKIDLVIIDSDNSFLPKDVLDNPVGASNIGKKAKLNSDVYPKFKGAIYNNNTCLVITSQFREKIGVMFGDPKTTQGGKALGFFADCIIELSKKTAPKASKEDDTVEHILSLKTIKNKTFSPFKKGECMVKFGIGLDFVQEAIDLGHELEILKVYGKTITYKDTKYLATDFVTLLNDNDALRKEITEAIKAKFTA